MRKVFRYDPKVRWKSLGLFTLLMTIPVSAVARVDICALFVFLGLYVMLVAIIWVTQTYTEYWVEGDQVTRQVLSIKSTCFYEDLKVTASRRNGQKTCHLERKGARWAILGPQLLGIDEFVAELLRHTTNVPSPEELKTGLGKSRGGPMTDGELEKMIQETMADEGITREQAMAEIQRFLGQVS